MRYIPPHACAIHIGSLLPLVGAVTISAAAVAPCARATVPARARRDPRESHLANVRQLTFGGQNAEAYFSHDGARLVFQSVRDGHPCDQEYVMRTDGSGVMRISTGAGRTTCGWWLPGDQRLLFSSTHASSPDCPPPPDYSHGYVWPVYSTYRIYTVNQDGSDLTPLYPRSLKPGEQPGYNAESVLSSDGKRIVFTSDRGGDLDIWVMDVDGRHARQLTHTLGYDGGPWWSPDDRHICYRAYHPVTEAEKADYRALLARHLIRPTTLDLFVMNADGSGVRKLTNDRAANIANFAPSWTPDGKALVFASNRDDPQRRKFDIYKIDLDGTGLERITYGGQFDSFPMFSPDGKHFVWASNRNGSAPHETNIFIADWVP